MEKFLVIQTAFIGDAVLTLPMIRKLKELNPESQIDVIAVPKTAEIFTHSAYVNEVHILDKHDKHKSVIQIYRFGKFLKQCNYSRIYAPHRSFRTSMLVMISGVKETYGFDVNSMHHIYKYIAEYGNAAHEVERNLRLIQFPLNNDNWKVLPEISIPPETENKIKDFIKAAGGVGESAAVAPGSVWNTKIYPPEYMEEVIRFLIPHFNRVFVTGGESDRELCTGFEKKFPGKVISVAGNFSLVESICFLKSMKLLITNDSAPSHLGMCADIPVLMLYCSTVPDFGFYPYNKKSYFLSFDDLFCKPCGIHGFERCPLGNFACGYNLKPESVISKIKEMIND